MGDTQVTDKQCEEQAVERMPDQRRVGEYWWYDREDGAPTIKVNPKNGDIHIGGQGKRGRILLQTADDCTTVEIDGATGDIEIRNIDGEARIRLDARNGDLYIAGELRKIK